jgi:5-formyltetrahydrofolate cyclo-ligase
MPADRSDIATRKKALRRRILAARDAVDAGLRRTWSEAIAVRLMARPELERAKTVHLFAGFGSEVDTLPIVRKLLDTGRRPVLPVVIRESWTLEHAAVSKVEDLLPGFKGILEPSKGCPRVDPGALDLVLVPGVAFDRRCGRLGYGGGFYDRFLAACRAPRIALVFSLQIVDGVPCDAEDLPVDLVVTEEEEIRYPVAR